MTYPDYHDCLFCQGIARGGATKRFIELFPKTAPNKQVLYSTSNFFLVPDDSPIVENHLLVIHKVHILSFACLNRKKLKELRKIKRKIIPFFKSQPNSNSAFFFEHGVGMEKDQIIRCGACSNTDHAHLHAIPISKERAKKVVEFLCSKIEFLLKVKPKKIGRNHLLIYKERPYLYIGNHKKDILFLLERLTGTILPSQYFRRLLGIFLKLPDAHWDLRHLHKYHKALERKRISETIKNFKKFDTKTV